MREAQRFQQTFHSPAHCRSADINPVRENHRQQTSRQFRVLLIPSFTSFTIWLRHPLQAGSVQ
jgi:hypothetical protein